MPKTLSQLRNEIAARLGFGSQGGAEIVQAPILDSCLQDAQELLINEFGSQIGSTVPPARFTDPNDEPSVPEYPLKLQALITAKIHYGQKADAEAQQYQNWETGVRGFAQ